MTVFICLMAADTERYVGSHCWFITVSDISELYSRTNRLCIVSKHRSSHLHFSVSCILWFSK